MCVHVVVVVVVVVHMSFSQKALYIIEHNNRRHNACSAVFYIDNHVSSLFFIYLYIFLCDGRWDTQYFSTHMGGGGSARTPLQYYYCASCS